ncbi:uncharacterized protein LOC141623612 [Silene latifolia]|uniref:uncharacterized protein LOC141623612 n=1 Tax=Silene latifolia TaxID=37657 RepID=UPI003D787613
MAANAFIVRSFQLKIDTIVQEAPKLFRRLNIIMAPNAIWNLLNNENPTLGRLRHLIVGDRSQISPAITTDFVSDEAVNRKRQELNILNNEVIILFQRLQTVLNWIVVIDLCCQGGQIIIRPENERDAIRMIEIYTDHVEAVIDERRREERRREIEPSSSSDDSGNLQLW